MSGRMNDSLPETLGSIRAKPLFVMRLNVRPLQLVGGSEGAYRRVGVVPGGTFQGDKVSGDVMEGGSDWQTVRGDGTTSLDVRLVLKTLDGVLIGMTYRGLRHGPPDIIKRVEQGESVDPSTYYFRINPMFETGNQEYLWLTRMLTIGIGFRSSDGVVYSIHEIA